MSASRVNMSLDQIIKQNKQREIQGSRGGATRGAGVSRGKAFRGARGGRGNAGMTRGIASRGVARPGGALQRRSAPALSSTGRRMSFNSIRGNINAPAPQNQMLNRMVKRAVKRALATTSRPRGGSLIGGGGILARRGLVRKPLGGGLLRRIGGQRALVGNGLNRVQAQSRVIQRRVAPQRLLVQRPPIVARRFQRISSPDVINRPVVVRQQAFRPRARPQTVVVHRIVRQAPPQRMQRTIAQRAIARQPQRQQIVERVIPRVRPQQQIIRRPVQQQVIRVQRVIQRPQQQIQYVQQRPQRGANRGANRGGFRRITNRVQVERVIPRFEYNNSPQIIVRRGRGFQNY